MEAWPLFRDPWETIAGFSVRLTVKGAAEWCVENGSHTIPKRGWQVEAVGRGSEGKGCWENLVLAGLIVRAQSRTEGGSSQLPRRPPLLGLPVTHTHPPEHFENKRAPAYPCRWDLWVWAASEVLGQCQGPLATPGVQRGAPLPRLSDGHVWGGKAGEPSERPATHPLAQCVALGLPRAVMLWEPLCAPTQAGR